MCSWLYGIAHVYMPNIKGKVQIMTGNIHLPFNIPIPSNMDKIRRDFPNLVCINIDDVSLVQ